MFEKTMIAKNNIVIGIEDQLNSEYRLLVMSSTPVLPHEQKIVENSLEHFARWCNEMQA